MKKIIFLAALALGSLTSFAQAEEMQSATSEEVVVVQDDYTEIALDELPQAITEAVAKNYPTATINKAYVNEAKQYKLEVALEDGTTGTLYSDENGNWIEQ